MAPLVRCKKSPCRLAGDKLVQNSKNGFGMEIVGSLRTLPAGKIICPQKLCYHAKNRVAFMTTKPSRTYLNSNLPHGARLFLSGVLSGVFPPFVLGHFCLLEGLQDNG